MALWVTWSLITLFILVHQIFAQVVDKRWITPDGSQADFATSFVAGNTITLAWKALNNSRSDLWLTHANVSGFPWHYQVGTNIDISKDNSFKWYIDVPASTITSDNNFILRFFPLNAPYSNIQVVQHDSPGFLLKGGVTTTATGGAGGVASTSQSTSTQGPTSTSISATSITSSSSISQISSYNQSFLNSTSTSNSSTSSILTTTNAAGNTITATVTTAIPPPTDVSSQNATSTPSETPFPLAAQAGIGVGAGIFIILLFAAGCFFGRRIGLNRTHRKYELQPTDTIVMQSGTKFGMFGDECTKVVRESRPGTGHTTLSEMDDTASMIKADRRYHQSRTPLVELMGSSSFPIEKAGSMVRPGVHEVH